MYSNTVFCCDCINFIRDTAGFGQGIGECKEYNDYKAKSPRLSALDKAFRMLGGKVFWGGNGGRGRYCVKYKVSE